MLHRLVSPLKEKDCMIMRPPLGNPCPEAILCLSVYHKAKEVFLQNQNKDIRLLNIFLRAAQEKCGRGAGGYLRDAEKKKETGHIKIHNSDHFNLTNPGIQSCANGGRYVR
jgi:hypothetical protein